MSGGCKDCKRVREHVASLLPFRVLEAVAGKPLRISGVAMAAGMSRNFNVYTVEELQAFADKLVGAPVYIEHVSVANAAGKVTKTTFDPVSRCLLYEAEIYDQAIADKIRNGLIQHVSVGADYDAVDVVDAMIPHGLFNAEMSLVAVPGIPETNIHVLEALARALKPKIVAPGAKVPQHVVKESIKELLEPLTCVFCGAPGTFLVSVCTVCGDKADVVVNGPLPAGQVLNALSRVKFSEAYLPSSPDYTTFKVRFQALGDNPCEICKALDGKEFVYGTQPELPIHENCKCGYDIVERLHVRREQLEPQMPGEYFLGFYQDAALFLSEHFRVVWLDQANGVLAVMAKTRADPALERCQAILFLKVKWQPNTVADWLSIHPDYQVAAGASVGLGVQGNGVEKLEEKDMDKIAEKVAVKVGEKESAAIEKLKIEVNEAKGKLSEAEGKVKTAESARDEAKGQLTVAKKTIEDLKKLVPGVDLLVDPPVLMQVSEHVAVLETLLPPVMVERSSMGMQRQGQAVRAAILKAKEKLQVG